MIAGLTELDDDDDDDNVNNNTNNKARHNYASRTKRRQKRNQQIVQHAICFSDCTPFSSFMWKRARGTSNNKINNKKPF